MTREEAIEHITAEKSYIEDIPGSDNTVKALNMAIEALEENPFEVVYYTGIFDLMARIKEKADEIDASALGGERYL